MPRGRPGPNLDKNALYAQFCPQLRCEPASSAWGSHSREVLNMLPRFFYSPAIQAMRHWVRTRQRASRLNPRPSAPPVTLLPPPKALIVGAHPDDEVIGAGILMTQLFEANLVQVTDGAPRNGKFAKALGLSGWEEYARVRREETERALAVAPTHVASINNIGIADQEAAYHLDFITRKMVELLPGHEVVITHAYEGGHPDHDSTALAVHAACRILQQSGVRSPI